MFSFENKLGVLRKIWSLLVPSERYGAIVMLGLMFLGMLFEMLGVGLVVPVIALLLQEDYVNKYPILQPVLEIMGNPSQLTLVISAMLSLVVIYSIKALYLAFFQWRQFQFAFGIQAQLSQRLFKIYLMQPYEFHLQNNSAQLIRNATVEVGMFITNAINPIMMLVTESLVVLGLCILLISIEPLGAMLVVGVVSFIGWIFHYLTRGYVTKWGQQRQLHEGLRIQHLQQGLGGAKDVKLLGRESEFLKQYEIHNFETARVGQLQQTLLTLPRLWLEVLAVAGLATLVITMSLSGYEMSAILSILALFAAAAFRLLPSLTRIMRAIQSLRFGLPVINTLSSEFKIKLPTTALTEMDRSRFSNLLEFKEVSYTYPDVVDSALKGVSFSIRRGESVGFIGSSGAGKSTLVDIMLGLLKPDSGVVCVDGSNIQENLRNWKNQIGYVPQAIFLTDDTLRRNVAFGLSDDHIDDSSVRKAIKLAQLEEFVQSLPEGLETIVGERGIRLSGGQRQRIGIARALYHDPAILVLDEATSSLDSATEHDVMKAVRALGNKKTVIIIAHRLTTVEHCDRLYKLKSGVIHREGSPATMLN